MQHNRTIAALAGLLTLLAGCAKTEPGSPSLASQPMEAGKAMASGGAASSEAPAQKAPEMPRKIIYTADVQLAAVNLDDAGGKIEASVKALGGYVSGRNLTGASGEARTGVWTVRMPSDKFDAFLAALPGVGELQSSNTTSQDVSEEFYDAQARLKNKRLEEDRLIQLLKTNAARLTDILTVEKELARVREEIERIEGRIRFLSHQSDLSTITINLHEVRGYIPPAQPGLGTEISRTFTTSIDAMGAFVKGITLAIVALLPWLALLGGTATGIWALARRARKAPDA